VRRRRSHTAPAPLIRADLPITIGFLLVAAWVLYQAWPWPFRTAVFPLGIGSVLGLCALAKLVAGARRTERPVAPAAPTATPTPVNAREADESENADPPDVFATASRREWLTAIAWMAAFFLLLWLVGALIAVPLFAVAYLITAARSKFVLAGVYAFASWLFIYGLFDRALRIPLPAGVLFVS
jgi:beta-lactamase regulating signal transducer with metallopeptidase domain